MLAGMTDDQPKRGRPSDYSAQLAMSICDRLADGESLRAICSQDARQATVFRWIARHKAPTSLRRSKRRRGRRRGLRRHLLTAIPYLRGELVRFRRASWAPGREPLRAPET